MLDQPEIGGRVALQPARHKRRAHVQNHGRGRPRLSRQGIERGGIGERLERRSRLAGRQSRIHRAVDALVEIIGTAHHRQDLSGVRIQRHQRGILRVVSR